MTTDAENPDPRVSNAVSKLPFTALEGPAYVQFRDLLAAFAHTAEVFCSSPTAAGTAITVNLPFDPALVIVINETGPTMHFSPPSLAAAGTFRITSAGAISKITTNGITRGAKAARTVTLGTSIQTTNDVVHLIAFGNRGLEGGS